MARRIGISTGLSQAASRNYQQALRDAGGRAGSIVPSYSGAGTVQYTFRPSGGGGGAVGASRETGGGFDYASLLANFEKREKGARKANIRRETEIRNIYANIINQGQGAARTAGFADIERTKTRAVGAGTQQMISSGLYGTTTAASIPVQAEQTAGLQRLKLEDMLQQRTNVAKLGLAGFVERIETPYPDYSALMQAYISQGSR